MELLSVVVLEPGSHGNLKDKTEDRAQNPFNGLHGIQWTIIFELLAGSMLGNCKGSGLREDAPC